MVHLTGISRTHIMLGVGVLLAFGVWWVLSSEPASDALLTTEQSSNLTSSEKSVVDTLLQLRAVSLEGNIFSDPAFSVLRDFGTQIVPEPVGRPNPFAPLSESTLPTGENESAAPQSP